MLTPIKFTAAVLTAAAWISLIISKNGENEKGALMKRRIEDGGLPTNTVSG
jgi:hypothetical protein